jgi:hypothetical protein
MGFLTSSKITSNNITQIKLIFYTLYCKCIGLWKFLITRSWWCVKLYYTQNNLHLAIEKYLKGLQSANLWFENTQKKQAPRSLNLFITPNTGTVKSTAGCYILYIEIDIDSNLLKLLTILKKVYFYIKKKSAVYVYL